MRFQPWTIDLPAQYRDFVTQHEQLDVLGCRATGRRTTRPRIIRIVAYAIDNNTRAILPTPPVTAHPRFLSPTGPAGRVQDPPRAQTQPLRLAQERREPHRETTGEADLAHPQSMQLKTTRASRWRDDFNGFYDQPTAAQAEAYLKRWCYGAKRSRREPIKEFVTTVEAHWDGITSWQQSRLSNGLLEGTTHSSKRRNAGPGATAPSPR